MKKANPSTDYDKLQLILDALRDGEDRNKLALRLGYSNPKSLDIYMRRKGFHYNSKLKLYQPIPVSRELMDNAAFPHDKRLSTILSLFAKPDPDPRKIAELTGFKSHTELADFLKEHHFVWKESIGNYVRQFSSELAPDDTPSSPEQDGSEFFLYLPLLRKLYENREKLYRLLDAKSSASETDDPAYEPSGSPMQLTLPAPLVELITQLLKK